MSEPHQLSIKVLRLGRPQLQPAQFDKPALYTEELVLPKTIGPCFAGERFQCLLSVIAEAATEKAHLVVEMQHQSTKKAILEESDITFTTDSPVTRKLDFELDTPGPRVLSVQIKYNDGEHLRTLNKVFSFEVLPVIKTRARVQAVVYPPGSEVRVDDNVEVQVENCTESTLTIEDYAFRHEKYTFDCVQPSSVILKPRDVYSFAGAAFGSRGFNELGEFHIYWSRDPLGHKGHEVVRLRR